MPRKLKYDGKIAICFLITADVSNPQVWEHWWKGYEDKINIYSHYSKGKEKNVSIPWLKNNRVPPVPTKWGDISLVKAEGQLYKEAIKNKQNKFTILVSGTCIPVRTFKYIYRRLMNNTKKGMMTYFREDGYKVSDDDFEPFVKSVSCTPTLVDKNIIGATLYSAHQWKILSRPNIKDFMKMLKDKVYMNMFQTCINVVPDSLAPDEFMYINYLKNKYGSVRKVVRDGAVTYVEFKGKAVHPVNFFHFTKRLKREVCDINSLFARKFPKYNPALVNQIPTLCGKTKR